MERWIGQVAVVTGASSGIGAAIAKKLVEAGVKVVGLARRSERIEQLAKELEKKPGKLYACKTDLSVESDIINAFKWTTSNVGPVSILINNAGVLTKGNLTTGDTSKWKQVFDVNVLGLCIATREAVKIMTSNGIAGHIVHINSITGQRHIYLPNTNVYGASKWAVTNLATLLRMELNEGGSSIKVTNVSPGVVDTEILESCSGEMEVIVKQLPKLRSEDVADAVLFALGTPPAVQISELQIQPLAEKL